PRLYGNQREAMLLLSGEEGRGIADHPGAVPGTVERRKRMAALTPGHVKQPLLLIPRRDDKPLRCAMVGRLDARHVRIARHRLRGHVEEAPQQGHRPAEGMWDPAAVVPAPGPPAEVRTVRSERVEHRICGGQNLLIPICEPWRK